MYFFTSIKYFCEKGKNLQGVYKIASISSKIGSKGTLHLILKEILLTRNFTTMSKNYNLWMFVSLAGGTIMFLWYEHVLHVKQ